MIANTLPISKEILQNRAFFRIKKRKIPLEDIVLLEADINYTHVHLINGGRIIVTQTLKNFETLLCDQQFIRVHKGYIINRQHVSTYDLRKKCVFLTNNLMACVSRRKRAEFVGRLIR
ncbi:LytTr DNA-binding domain-containing protein [Pseudarcicella hirudinis]|uniref:LytTr DNA-binding domain-containing protein n=1 Tax=Pseudarcicella hirudinis TaxID=1079859 RepID=A0A1I5P3W3_9BACT|nr:LytTR family DNA-binding domain-containing protein [Pseudarcicella hirudinis]SFP28653.1 LytTr DNA-binding domain-containing protein [Pseudarcicella hirudinis]